MTPAAVPVLRSPSSRRPRNIGQCAVRLSSAPDHGKACFSKKNGWKPHNAPNALLGRAPEIGARKHHLTFVKR
jgi:hypothetical protein